MFGYVLCRPLGACPYLLSSFSHVLWTHVRVCVFAALCVPFLHLFRYRDPSTEKCHWDHRILPHWSASIRDNYIHDVRFKPLNDDIGANFFPDAGLYDSADKAVMDRQMQEMKTAGADVSMHAQTRNKRVQISPLVISRAPRIVLRMAYLHFCPSYFSVR